MVLLLYKILVFPLRISSANGNKSGGVETTDFLKLISEIVHGDLPFLCSVFEYL